jgi:S1-C subfamily serine protease
MFGTLAAFGLVSGGTPVTTVVAGDDTATGSGEVSASPTSYSHRLPDGVIAVRLTGAANTTFATGIVIGSKGEVVTTLDATDDDGSPLGALAIESGSSNWTTASIVGTDPVTGLTVLEPSTGRSAKNAVASDASATLADTAPVAAASLGQSVDMAQAASLAVGARYTGGSPTRVTSTNACITSGSTTMVGLLTLTSPRPTGATEVAVDPTSGAVTGLVLPNDDNPSDEMSYAVPADLAVRVGRQIVVQGHADHGALPATLATTDDGAVVVLATSKSGTDLVAGDELLSVAGRPVHTVNDVAGALLGTAPGDSAAVTVRRSNRQRSFDATVVAASSASASNASTTSLP